MTLQSTESKKESAERHKVLHRHLDELLACYITQAPKHPTEGILRGTSLLEFMEWSFEMTKNPTCAPHWQHEEEKKLSDPG